MELRGRTATATAAAGVAAVYLACAAIATSGLPARAPTVIPAALAFDLIATAAVVTWWLGVRRAGWPRWTVAVAAGAGRLAAWRLIPAGAGVLVVVLAVEAVVVATAVMRSRTIARVARAHPGPGPVAALEAGLRAADVPARLVPLLATELTVLGLGLGGWVRRAPAGRGFAMHRRKSWAAIVAVLLGLIAVEGAAVHVMLAGWSPVAAWLATASSLYAALWLAADYHALRLYPLEVTADAVRVAVGLRWRVELPRAAITAVALTEAAPSGALAATVVEPTVLVTLDRPVVARGLLGRSRRVTAVALTVDEPAQFAAALGHPIA